MDLTLRDGVNLQEAIHSARQMDEQSKAAGFYQEALDFTARKGFENARFELNSEEGLDVLDEFYAEDESEQTQTELKTNAKPKFNQREGFVQDIQQGLQGSVRAVN